MSRPPALRVAFLALLSLLPAFAQELPPPSPLTLEEAVTRALAHNFDVELQRFDTRNAVEQVTIADAVFDPNFEVKGSVAGDSDNSGRSSQQQTARVGVTQRLPTGADAELSTNLFRTKNPATASFFNPVYNSDVSLRVTQPLLQGFGVTLNRAAIERSKLGVARAREDFRAVIVNLIRNVESAYYNLVFAREQLAVRRLSLDVAETLLRENRARLEVGSAIQLDVLQSEVGVANARRDLLLAQQSVTDNEDTLLDLIGRFDFDRRPGPVSLPADAKLDLSVERSYGLALANSPGFAANKLLAEQLKLDVDVARNDRLPTLDLGATLGLNGDDRSSAGDALGRVGKDDDHNWQVDLTLNIPWGLRAERARYRRAQNDLHRQQAFLQQFDQGLLLQVRTAVRAVETNRETVAVSELATRLSENQFESVKARYDAGATTFRFVEDARRDLDTARVNELLARVNLRIALAELSRLEATSLDRFNVKLED